MPTPEPLFSLPLGLLNWTALAVAAATVLTAAAAHMAARSTAAGAVLRLE